VQLLRQNWPNRIQSGDKAPNATDLYRAILAAQPDQSVTLIAIGPLRNLYYLLLSSPDAHSPLTGAALVAQKVKLLSCMGGGYPTGDEFNFNQVRHD
jgi:inosine-uridine nucleoside N-ribohydrolase